MTCIPQILVSNIHIQVKQTGLLGSEWFGLTHHKLSQITDLLAGLVPVDVLFEFAGFYWGWVNWVSLKDPTGHQSHGFPPPRLEFGLRCRRHC